MSSYTILTYDPDTALWGWMGTVSNADDDYFEASDYFHYRDEVVKLPDHFLRGARVHTKRLMGTKGPRWYWVENSTACQANE